MLTPTSRNRYTGLLGEQYRTVRRGTHISLDECELVTHTRPRTLATFCFRFSDDLDLDELQLDIEDSKPHPSVQCSPVPGKMGGWGAGQGTANHLNEKSVSRSTVVLQIFSLSSAKSAGWEPLLSLAERGWSSFP